MHLKKTKKIFIVDDDEMVTTALEDHLSRNTPHSISTFATGEACLANLEMEPDIIILDYYLNTGSGEAANGMEILQLIKHDYPGIHVIMLSSQDRYGVAIQSIQKGAEQYVIKDENAFDEILKIIREIN